MGWVEVLPHFESHFRGWDKPTRFLEWTGVLVNHHRTRQVEHVTHPSFVDASGYFVKKEFAVTLQDRFRNAWQGFGWCSTAVREAALLQALRQAGIGCPEVAALGEDGRSAFVLTRAADGMTELRSWLQLERSDEERAGLAKALGGELARMHSAGFDHPDLYAKHILVGPENRFCILDWQRGRRRRTVPWRLRCRDLAMLDATLHDTLGSDRLRLRCLRAYLRASGNPVPLGRLARRIRAQAERLRNNRNVREIGQLPVLAADQQFVSLEGGALWVVRSYFEQELRETKDVRSFANASGSEILACPPSREIPTLAHTLFRLQRFGIAAPKLVGVRFERDQVLVLTRLPAFVPVADVLAKASADESARVLHQAGQLIRLMHEAGYSSSGGDGWINRLGVERASGSVVLVMVEPLKRRSLPWREWGPAEFNRQLLHLSRSEQSHFLDGYLRRGSPAPKESGVNVWERQGV